VRLRRDATCPWTLQQLVRRKAGHLLRRSADYLTRGISANEDASGPAPAVPVSVRRLQRRKTPRYEQCRFCAARDIRSHGVIEDRAVWECVTCGTVATFALFDFVYEGDYSLGDDPVLAAHRLQVVCAAVGRPAFALLDIGFGKGTLLRQARGAGLDAYGVDTIQENVTPVAAELGGEHAVCCCLDEQAGQLPQLFPGRLFDAIMLYDVLEHFPDPGGVLANIGRLLSPRGVLVLVVPRAESRRDAQGHWSLEAGYPFEHYYDISARGLAALIPAHGFELMTLGPDPFEGLRRENNPQRFTGVLARRAS
jgi:2-polyprenyl-3-methyl-5-hydroxy-6-metoxy-1,4-benzoquinol methylase